MAELSKLGRYQLKGVLGRGAMGVVYEGLDPSLNRRVAVKTILKNAAIDAETAQMYSAQFAREAQAAGRLNHPNIVGVHDFAEEGDVAYLVMEYIQGRELRSFFEAKEKFEIAEVVRIMGELLDALGFAHDAGVIHRDIKPANVMLDVNRRVKLADFGVARIQDSERSAAGTMVGTPAFMSPEQISGGKIDKRTDLFSAGTILYQLLTGDQPFTGAGAWTVAKKIMQDDPPRPSSVVKSVSPVFDAIVNKALAKKPAERYASAKEFADALRGALGSAQPSAQATTPPIPAIRPTPGAQASEAEVEFWKAIQNSTDAAEFEFYLEQFPQGTYAGLARHKIARLTQAPVPPGESTVRLQAEAAAKQREAEEKARLEAEAQAKREAELQAAAKARRDAAEKARREAEAAEAAEKAQREAAEKAKREAEEKARREAETRARVEAELKAKHDADEKAKQERARQAAALAKLKEQEAARATEDPEATVAIARPSRPPPAAASAPPPVAAAPKKSMLMPAIIGAVVVLGGAAAFFAMNRAPAPVPVAEAPAPAKVAVPAAPAAPAAPVVDEAKIRREVEERIRREYADKSVAEQAAAAKAATEKAVAEKQLAAKSALSDRAAADKAAAEKAAAEKAMAEKLAAAKSAGERAALEKAASEKAEAERLAAEKAAAEKAAAEKVAAEKAAAERAAAEKAAAEKQAAGGADALLERFIQRKGAQRVLQKEPAAGYASMGGTAAEIFYINDGTCPRGQIKELTTASPVRNISRGTRCIWLADERPASDKPADQATPAAAKAAEARETADPQLLQRFTQRVGADKVLTREPPRVNGAMMTGQAVYVNDGSCPRHQIQQVTAGDNARPRGYRCISLE